MEKAIIKYKELLKRFYNLDSTNKEHDIVYYKLCGMETILEAMDVNINVIRKDVEDQIK